MFGQCIVTMRPAVTVEYRSQQKNIYYGQELLYNTATDVTKQNGYQHSLKASLVRGGRVEPVNFRILIRIEIKAII